MTRIATIPAFATTCNRDIVRRLMAMSDAFKGMTFANAMAQFRYADRQGWVNRTPDFITIDWDYE